MAAKNNLTMTSDVQVTAREIDFVTRFARNWQHLRDILGIMRPIKKQPGTVLKSKTASVTLAQSVGEGEEIPYSKATVIEKDYANINVEKYAKAVSIEAIKEYGYDFAVAITDQAFLYELQTNVTNRFYHWPSERQRNKLAACACNGEGRCYQQIQADAQNRNKRCRLRERHGLV